MEYTKKALMIASALLVGAPAAFAQQLPAGYIGRVTGNTPNTWQTYSYTYTPSTSGANFVGFAFRQDPAFWSFDNARLYAPGSTVNLFTNGDFATGGSFSITTNNGPLNIQAPNSWGVWYQNGTYPAAAGTWTNGMWYDGAVGSFDGIYQGVNLTAGTQYTVTFDVSGNNTANTSSIQLGTYAGLCQDTTLAPNQCTIPSSYGFTTLATPAQGAAAGAPAITVTGTSTTDQVTTTAADSTTSATTYVTRTETDTDADGNPRVRTYTDTVVTTTPVTTTTTTTTPVTTTTYSDGTSTSTNGTPVVTTSSSNGTPTSTVTASVLQTTAITRPSYSYNTVVSGAPTVTHTPTFATSEKNGKQRLNVHVTTGVTTPLLTTVTLTPVTTTTDANGNETVTNGTPVDSYVASTTYDEYHSYRDFYGRVDQLEVFDNISNSINGLLDHEPMTNHKKRFRVFETNRFAQSYNADEYKASSTVFGGGFEFDLTKGWTAGAQYNEIYSEMKGVDSISHLKRQHIGIFNSFHGKNVALVTNAGGSQDKYDYARTLEWQFGNYAKVDGQQWWVHNRLYVNNSGWFKPFLGYTVSNIKRNAYDETGSPQSARSVEAFNQTTHVGEAGAKIEFRFGGKKHNLIGVSVDGSYGTDNSYSINGSLDYKEVLFVEGSHDVNGGVTTNSIAGRVKFRF
jgi:hypothetical protein